MEIVEDGNRGPLKRYATFGSSTGLSHWLPLASPPTFGVLFYLFIVVAGVISVNCPYQTPGADFIRHIPDILYHIQDTIHSIRDIFRRILRRLLWVFGTPYPAFRTFIKESYCLGVLTELANNLRWIYAGFRCHLLPNVAFDLLYTFLSTIPLLPFALAADACKVIIRLLVGLTRQVYHALLELLKQQMLVQVLDLRCISWTLKISVDEPVRRSALEFLAIMMLDDSDPTQVVADWFDILLNCVKVTNRTVTIVQGLEELTATASLFCLRMLSHLVVMDPTPKILEDVRRRYIRTIPSETSFADPLVRCILGAIHRVFHQNHVQGRILPFPQHRVQWRVQWNNYEPSSDEHVKVACALTNFAWFEYRRSGSSEKVPRWILRFALHSLSRDPLPPASVVTDSLSIIAIDLGCDVSDIVTIHPPDQRCVCIKQVIIALTQYQRGTRANLGSDNKATHDLGQRS